MRNTTANRRHHKARQARPAKSAQSHFSPMEPLEARELMSAAVYTVTNTLDNTHKGSLRWAINQVNRDAGKKGTDTINFAIGSGLQTIEPLTQLPGIKYSVNIDATTQPGYSGTPLIELDGSSSDYGADDALVLGGCSSTVQGMAIDHFYRGIVAKGNNDLINANVLGGESIYVGSYSEIFTKAVDVYGSNTTVTNNTVNAYGATGIMLESESSSNVVSKNTVTMAYVGIDDSINSDNNQFYGNTIINNVTGMEIDGHHNHVGDGDWADSNTIGQSGAENEVGVQLDSGTNEVATNVITFNDTVGILMSYNDDATDTVTGTVSSIAGNHNSVEGNFIGYNGQNGITLDQVKGNNIGGPGSFSGGNPRSNTIVSNTFDGIYVGLGSVQNTFSRNYIDTNGTLGIELAPGANDDQAPPTLYSAYAYSLSAPSVVGTFQGAANSTYHLEFFVTTSGTPNQGANYMGSVDVTTDSQGYLMTVSSTEDGASATVIGTGATAEFNASFSKAISATANVVTATATNSVGDTSAFSNGVNVYVAP